MGMRRVGRFGLLAVLVLLLAVLPAGARRSSDKHSSAADRPPAHGPWSTEHFVLGYPSALHDRAAECLLWLEQARIQAQQIFSYVPILPVQVSLCNSAEAYRKAGGTGDPYDGCVVRDVLTLQVSSGLDDALGAALTHLYIRLAIRKVTVGRLAPWLAWGVEGFMTDRLTPSLGVVAGAAKSGALGPLGPGCLDAPGPASDNIALSDTQKAEAVFAVYCLVQAGGAGTLDTLLGAVGRDEPWAQALKAVLNRTPAEFDADWMRQALAGVRHFSPPGVPQGSWAVHAGVVPAIPRPPAPGKLARIRMVVGDYDLPPTGQVDALLVVGGNVVVRGIVTARIAVLGGSLRIGQTARVAGRITILGGSLSIDDGAVVKGAADVSAGYWSPSEIHSDRVDLRVAIMQPTHVDLRLPGESGWLQEGTVNVPVGEDLDNAIAVGGALTILGTVRQRAVAIGGDVTLPADVPENLIAVAVGGSIRQGDKMLEGSTPLRTQIQHFIGDFTAPAQPGADPVPVYVGVGDSSIGTSQTFDAFLCAGGNCMVSGAVYGGLIIGGDLAGLNGSTLAGPIWGFGGRVLTSRQANAKGLDVRGDAAAPVEPAPAQGNGNQ